MKKMERQSGDDLNTFRHGMMLLSSRRSDRCKGLIKDWTECCRSAGVSSICTCKISAVDTGTLSSYFGASAIIVRRLHSLVKVKYQKIPW